MRFQATHGESPIPGKRKCTPEYEAWCGMKRRTSPRAKQADREVYFNRGIAVCERWANDYLLFLQDMGRKPTRKHSLDRIDGTKGYAPENCRWATPQQQIQNRRVARMLTVNGETLNAQTWCRRLAITDGTLYYYLRKGLASFVAYARARLLELEGANL